MKKIFTIALAAFALFAVTSCGASVEQKANDFAKEMHEAETNSDQLMKVQAEKAEYERSLSETELQQFTTIYTESYDKLRGL